MAVWFLAVVISLSLKYKHCCNTIIKLALAGIAIKPQLAGYCILIVVKLTNNQQCFKQMGRADNVKQKS